MKIGKVLVESAKISFEATRKANMFACKCKKHPSMRFSLGLYLKERSGAPLATAVSTLVRLVKEELAEEEAAVLLLLATLAPAAEK